LTDLHALWTPTAKVTDQDFLIRWMYVWNSSGTGIYAFSTTSAFLIVRQDSAGFPAYGQGLERTGLNTWIVFALSTQMRKIRTWNQHEDSYSRCFRPDPFFMMKRAGNLTLTASTAFRKVSRYPDGPLPCCQTICLPKTPENASRFCIDLNVTFSCGNAPVELCRAD